MQKPDSTKDNAQASSGKATNPALLGILKNSLHSSIKHETTAAGVVTRKCSACGAARPEGTDLTICDYCGNPFN